MSPTPHHPTPPRRAWRALFSGSLACGAFAGLTALAIDQLLVFAILGYAFPLTAVLSATYAGLGMVCALVIGSVARRSSLGSSGNSLSDWRRFTSTLAAVYGPAIFERATSVLEFRASWPIVMGLGGLALGGFLLWIAFLVRITRGSAMGPLLAAVSIAVGLAINRNLIEQPLQPTALAADAAVLATAAALAWLTRLAGAQRATIVLTGIAVVALGLGTREGWGSTSRLGDSRAEGPNVVLVVIDTLRQDTFEAVVRETPEGQAFDRAMGGSAWFSQAIAASPWTVPSMGTIMTGLHPPEHGYDARLVAERRRVLRPLPESVPTVAERLQRHGYRTEGLITNQVLQPAGGIARGFDHYEILSGPTAKLPALTVMTRLGWFHEVPYEKADALRRRLGQRLAVIDPEAAPLFLWLHLLDPHTPLHEHPELAADPQALQLPRRERLYREETRFALLELTLMFEMLENHGLWNETAVIVVSDHGEMFPSDGHDNGVKTLQGDRPKTYGHGHAMYDELVRVPLVIRPPGGLTQKRQVDVLTSHADLHDTILDLAGVDRTRLDRTRTKEAPFSLHPWLAAEPPDQDAEGRPSALISGIQRGPRQRALRTAQFKLIDYPDKQRPNELFLLGPDPDERTDLIRHRPDLRLQARRRLEQAWDRLAVPSDNPTEALDAEALDAEALDAEALDAEALDAEALDAEALDAEALDAETLRRLEALGYL